VRYGEQAGRRTIFLERLVSARHDEFPVAIEFSGIDEIGKRGRQKQNTDHDNDGIYVPIFALHGLSCG
jgi:hypothetical protein